MDKVLEIIDKQIARFRRYLANDENTLIAELNQKNYYAVEDISYSINIWNIEIYLLERIKHEIEKLEVKK